MISLLACLLAGCSSAVPPPVHPKVELARYMGTWHEVARLPFYWERNCVGSSAYYQQTGPREFSITNYCWYKSFFGPMRKSTAEAQVDDDPSGAKFKVEFFWPFFVDYWVLWVSDDYRQALVGSPDRELLWLLSRDFTIAPPTFDKMLRIANRRGFDTTKLIRTEQHSKKSVAEELDRRLAKEGRQAVKPYKEGGKPARCVPGPKAKEELP